MIYLLQDGEEAIGLVANIDRAVIDECVRRVDKCFRDYVDQVPHEMLPKAMCADIGIPHTNAIGDWADVLVALLCSKGATRVDYVPVQAIP